VPDELHVVGDVVLTDEGGDIEAMTVDGAGRDHPLGVQGRPGVEEEDLTALLGLDQRPDGRRLVVDDRARAEAGPDERPQSRDLRGDDLDCVA
jgi:hypothetical protein